MLLKIADREIFTKLVGVFNAYNILCVFAVASILGLEVIEILKEISRLDSVEGRFQCQVSKNGITAIVDYAHTPDALENVLTTINELRHGNGNVITVVGCGGNRDISKRATMTKVASRLSKVVILTSDNPREENPKDIIDDMKKGVTASKQSSVFIVLDREHAIKKACNMAGSGDVVLIADKIGLEEEVLNIAVVGAGESGVGAAILAKKRGYNVFVSDGGNVAPKYIEKMELYQIDYESNRHDIKRIKNADIVVKSPGINRESDVMKQLLKSGSKIISEIEFAFQNTDAHVLAVTGTNGKTTTVSLVYDIMKRAGYNVGLAGNIGKSFAEQVALENKPYYVLEISSFQLDDIEKFRPRVAVLTNITPDHLECYQYTFENYIKSKFRITENQTEDDIFIYDADDINISNHMKRNDIKASKLPFATEIKLDLGICLQEEQMQVNFRDNRYSIDTTLYSLQGRHNVKNAMAATAVAEVMKIDKEIIRNSLQMFHGKEHRLEKVPKQGGVLFFNDSKATNINAVFYALESMSRPTVWIVGGIDKGNDYSVLFPLVWEKVKAIVCIGKDNKKIVDSFKKIVPNIVETQSMDEAVLISYGFSEYGDAVLLSPACASFDVFKNYEDRVIGTGGYASLLVAYMAAKRRIPVFIQEQNSYPGIANKILSKYARNVFVAYDDMDRFFPKHKIINVGNPIRQNLSFVQWNQTNAFSVFNVDPDKKVLLVLGGSLGAKLINEMVEICLEFFEHLNIHLIWQCGECYIEKYDGYNDLDFVEVYPFIKRMDMAYALADVIISRAGAGAISELCMVAKPLVLIPSPNVTEDHQYKNAKVLEDMQGAKVFKESDLEENLDDFKEEFQSLIESPTTQKLMSIALKEMARPDAARDIVNHIVRCLK
ncbi:UDP-N-acetylmuramoylalanine--D-glutamate ligase [Elysia marginata]|uniref:UDP-N-acetylmuramoylalanine--D-glutamate ligase n=1 Tax=Elysia marginata TaxID=1093978 RepID=A0AAV4F1J7_9GAST|nr:UDP-N-acetylmuramoylalanine--D-glutamate ligase [Elysia marginata]